MIPMARENNELTRVNDSSNSSNEEICDFKGKFQMSGDLNPEDSEQDPYSKSACQRYVERLEDYVGRCFKRNRNVLRSSLWFVLLLAYLAYFSYCMAYSFGDGDSYLLIFITVIILLVAIKQVMNRYQYEITLPTCINSCCAHERMGKLCFFTQYFLAISSFVCVGVYLWLNILMSHPRNLSSLVGVLVIILVCYITSTKPSAVQWHPVYWGFVIQFAFASLTLQTQAGYDAFMWLGDSVQRFLAFSDAGSKFIISKDFLTMGLVFQLSGLLIFFNAILFALTYLGVVQFIMNKVGGILGFCLKTGPVESMIAGASILFGQVEASLLIRPYIADITNSELHAIMTCGFASISGSVLAIFIMLGAPPNHLLTAAVISAPAALALAKLSYPETSTVNLARQQNITFGENDDKGRTLLSVCSDGAVMAVSILASLMSNMLAFVSILGMLDSFLNWFGRRAGYNELSFDLMCSYLLWPVAYVMGTELEDCGRVAALIGVKLFATPMVGYAQLGEIIQNRKKLELYLDSTNGTGLWSWDKFDVVLEATNTTLRYGVMSERSEVISTYAMCGLSSLIGIGCVVGLMIPICPSRKKDIIDLVLRSFYIGNMASFATGAIAGVMFTGGDRGDTSTLPSNSSLGL